MALGAVCLKNFCTKCGVAVTDDRLDSAEALDDLNQRGQLRRAMVSPARHRAAVYPVVKYVSQQICAVFMLRQIDWGRL